MSEELVPIVLRERKGRRAVKATWTKETWEKVDTVFGWLTEEEAEALFTLANKAPWDSSIVELGAFMGRSTVALASGARMRSSADKYVISVDVWIGTQDSSDTELHWNLIQQHGGDLYAIHKKNLNDAGLSRWVRRIRGRTSVEGIEWAIEWDLDIGLLFIDACHDYEAVKADFDTWSKLVVPGGVVAFHDSFAPGPGRVISEVGTPFKRLPDVGSLAIFIRE